MNTFSTTIMVVIPIYFGSHSCFAFKFKKLISTIASGLKMWNTN